MLSLLVFFILPTDSFVDEPQLLQGILFVTFLISKFIFMCYITILAGASNRLGILWFIGSGILPPFSSFIAYYRMQVIAIKNGWA
jgi:hypothetical protein